MKRLNLLKSLIPVLITGMVFEAGAQYTFSSKSVQDEIAEVAAEIAPTQAPARTRSAAPKKKRLRLSYQNPESEASSFASEMGTSTAALPDQEPSFVTLFAAGGATVSKMTGGGGSYSFSERNGYTGGLGLLIGRGVLQLESGAYYSQRGAYQDYSDAYGKWSYEFDNSYIEVPAYLRVRLELGSSFSIFAKAGAVLAFLQESKVTLGNLQNYYIGSSGKSQDGKDYFESFDPRWAVGVGATIKFTRSVGLLLQADLQESFKNSSTIQPHPTGGTTAMKLSTSSYGLSAGLQWEI